MVGQTSQKDGHGKSEKTRIVCGISWSFRMYVYELRQKEFLPKLAASVFRDESDWDYSDKLRVEF